MKTLLLTIVLVVLSAVTIFQEHYIHGLIEVEQTQNTSIGELAGVSRDMFDLFKTHLIDEHGMELE